MVCSAVSNAALKPQSVTHHQQRRLTAAIIPTTGLKHLEQIAIRYKVNELPPSFFSKIFDGHGSFRAAL